MSSTATSHTHTFSHDSQIASFLARQPYLADHTGAEEPQVIFRGALELDREQEQSMVDDTFKRIGELENELGYREAGQLGPDGISAMADGATDIDSMKHIPKRLLWDMIFRMKMGWRRDLWAGIYKAGQNLHMPFTRRAVQQMIARAQNHYFAAEPFCNVSPVGLQDPETAATANEWAQHKFKAARLKNHGMKAIEIAGTHGEVIIKKGHRRDTHSYETYARVLMAPAPALRSSQSEEGSPPESLSELQAQGSPPSASDPSPSKALTSNSLTSPEALPPLLDTNGDYIIEADDLWTRDQYGQVVLRADGVTPQPPGYGPHLFHEAKIRRSLVTYNGPDARPVDVRNFLAPLEATDLQCKQADTVVHYYDMTAIEIVEQFITRLQQAGRWDPNLYPRTLEYLRRASSNSRRGSQQPRPDLGEPEPSLRADPVIRVAEVYRWYDATQTGQLDNLYMLLDRDTRQPLLYEHVANVFEDGKRPFTPIQWWPIDGRWTGTGAVEVFWELQKFIDLQTNRWDLSLSESGSKTFFNPEQTVEGQLNPRLSINDQTTFRKRDVNVPADRILERVHLHEFKGAKLEGLVQFVGQLFTNMSGVANANDAAAMGMDTAKLATGVNNIQQSGEEMFTPILVNMEPGITEVVADSLAIAVEHMDEREAFQVTGPDGVVRLKDLQRQDARQFRWHVALEVTSSKGERDVAQMTAATEAGKDYLALPPPWQLILAPLYRQRLKAHGVKDVHKVITTPTQEELQAWQQQNQPQGTGQAGGMEQAPGQRLQMG